MYYCEKSFHIDTITLKVSATNRKSIKNKYVIIVTMHSIHGYILGVTAIHNMLVMYHVEFTATCQFYTNIILYMHANNLKLIYACL